MQSRERNCWGMSCGSINSPLYSSMKLSTMVVNTIEMTQEEEDSPWRSREELRAIGKFGILGQKILNWETGDGQNCMLLEGEKTFRQIVIVN